MNNKNLVVFQFILQLYWLLVSGESVLPPLWDSSSPVQIFRPEDTPFNGTYLTTIRATGRNGVNVVIVPYDDITKSRVYLNYTTGTFATANLYLIKQMDRDAGISEWHLLFQAYDSKIGKDQVPVQTLTIVITDVNDNPPHFNQPFYNAEVKEDARKLTRLNVAIEATDPDNGAGGVVSYELQPAGQASSLYKDAFRINSTTGVVTLNGKLDYAKLSFYQYNIFAKDKGTPPLISNSSVLVIKVVDVQNTAPYFQGLPYVTSIDENVAKDSDTSITALALDGDTGVPNTITYSFSDASQPCYGLFEIDKNTGKITTKEKLDRDAPPVNNTNGICRLRLEAKETNSSGQPQKGNTTTYTEVVITVNDLNDNVPIFSQSVYNANVSEGISSIPITIGDGGIDVEDIDQAGNNEFHLELQYTNGSVSHDLTPMPTAVNGKGNILLRLNGINNFKFDYEKQKTATYILVAKEPSKPSHNTSCTVSISILDINDNDPEFDKESYTAHTKENQTDSTVILTVHATDKDSGNFGKITYNLSGDKHFEVNSTTGEIRTVNASEIDREKQDEYFLTLEAKDGGDRRKAVGITVHILDINDNAPKFLQRTYKYSLTEEDSDFEEPVIITAVDNDKENTNNSAIMYSVIPPGSLTNNFTIDPDSGTITLTSPLDYEKLDDKSGDITLIVLASDKGSPQLSTNVSVDIRIRDINDNSPIFDQPVYYANISEYEDPGNTVTKVSATDNDGSPENSRITYYIEKGGKDKFRINGETGVITVDIGVKFDRETEPMYNLTVLAIDRGTPPLNGTSLLYVTIDDVNDEKPEFGISTYTAKINESAGINDHVIDCIATDADLNSVLKYSIINVVPTPSLKPNSTDLENVKNYFGINDNGTIYVKSTLDRETVTAVTLTINVTDLHGIENLPQTATAKVEITIEDSNDNPPVFVPENYTIKIIEGRLSGVVLTLTAIDADYNNELTYDIVNNPLNAFTIEKTTGVISRRQDVPIDREKNETLLMNVSVSDTLHRTYTTVLIIVQDVNDNDPLFSPPTYTTNITENNGTETYDEKFVYQVMASDKDDGRNAKLYYSITGGNLGNVFVINDTIGEITVHGNIDRENTSQYILLIEARDDPIVLSERRTGIATVTIEIDDINDNHPYFQKLPYDGQIQEDTNLGKTVLTVTAKDDDAGQNAMLSYSLTDYNDSSLFSIDENSGHIVVNRSLQDHYGTYKLKVWAKDHGLGNLENSTDVQIVVTDLNDHDPKFVDLKPSYKVYECARINTLVTVLSATDRDHGLNSLLEFKFDKLSTDGNHTDFVINNATGDIRTTVKLDASVKSQYKYRVQVRDHGDPPRFSPMKEFTIIVIDVNDNPPEFPSNSTNTQISENVANVSVTTVTAYDKDQNSEIRYSILRNFNESFEIDINSGVITIIKEIDREKQADVTLRVRAIDITARNISAECDNETINSFSNTTEMDVHIKILDVNDNPPVFISKDITHGIRRDVKLNTTIFDLKQQVKEDPSDEGINAIHSYSFNGNFTFSTPALKTKIEKTSMSACPGTNNQQRAICLTGNGSVLTNILFEEDMTGTIIIPIHVQDAAGNDNATLRLDIISDAQTVAILIYDNKAYVQKYQDDILREFTKRTGYKFTANGMEPYVESGIADPFRTYLFCHVSDNGNILSAAQAKQIVDDNALKLSDLKNAYKISDVKEYKDTLEQDPDNGIKTTYILIGIIILLGVTVLIVGFFYCNSVARYQRKLKAQTTKSSDQDGSIKESHPGTNVYARNQNPLLNKETEFSNIDYNRYEDDISVASYDSNQFKKKEPVFGDEEKGATMDMYDEEIQMQGEIDALAMVLQQHKKEKAASQENLTSDVMYNEEEESEGFVNEGFDLNLETTEV